MNYIICDILPSIACPRCLIFSGYLEFSALLPKISGFCLAERASLNRGLLYRREIKPPTPFPFPYIVDILRISAL